MKTIKDISGQKFNRLTAVKFTHINNDGKACFDCVCDCGNTCNVSGKHLRSGNTKSCGCLRNEKSGARFRTHGYCSGGKTLEYHIWRSMISRCENPNNKNYNVYGGRGIRVCDEWRRDFNKFITDMGEKPFANASIDRIDSNGNYEKSNCKWSTPKDQQNNKRNNKKILFNNQMLSVRDVSAITGIKYNTIIMRLHRGASVEKATSNESEILFRASAAFNIMVEPRNKTELLSETTKKYLTEVFVQHKYGRKKDIVNKYVQKGRMSEEDSLTLLSRLLKVMFVKNETHFSNDFVCGTPDIITDKFGELMVIDTKTSWDIWTFMHAKTEPLNRNYYWQLQVYMALTGARKAMLSYCLVDTPDVLITDAKRKFMWNAGILDENPITEEAFAEIERNSIFSDIPIDERVHTIEIPYNAEDIERLYMRIEDCRAYIQKTFNFPMVQIPETV